MNRERLLDEVTELLVAVHNSTNLTDRELAAMIVVLEPAANRLKMQRSTALPRRGLRAVGN